VHNKLLIGAVGLGLVATVGAGTAVYAAKDKTVTIVVDGRTRTVHTMAGTVAGVLAGQAIHPSARDVVAPALSAPVTDGSRIAVQHARQLVIDVDGKRKRYWVTANNVRDALDQLGLRFGGAKLSVSRSTDIGRSGLEFDVTTVKHVVVRHDHKRQKVATTARTVRGALAAAHVRLDQDDRLNTKPTAKLRNGMVVTVVRVDVRRATVTTPIDYHVLHRADLTMLEGTETIEQHGAEGKRATVYRLVFHDGKLVSRTKVGSKVVRAPVDEVIRYGAKEPPPPEPKKKPTPKKPAPNKKPAPGTMPG